MSNDADTDWTEELQKIDIRAALAMVEGGLEQLLEYSRDKIECHLQAGRIVDSYKVGNTAKTR